MAEINLKDYITSFIPRIGNNEIEIYNEFSLQHELGIHLRNFIGQPWKVHFERHVSFFREILNPKDYLNKKDYEKREIDIVVFNTDESERYAIELKYPRNGQYPEQMFKICQDILFLEQLVVKGGFIKGYLLVIADDPLFYGNGGKDGIYQYFRAGEKLCGNIKKPTGKQDHSLELQCSYDIGWQEIKGNVKYKYILLEIDKNT